jgi:hypothetical protein
MNHDLLTDKSDVAIGLELPGLHRLPAAEQDNRDDAFF